MICSGHDKNIYKTNRQCHAYVPVGKLTNLHDRKATGKTPKQEYFNFQSKIICM